MTGRPQPATVELTPAALERHLQGLTEKLRSGMTGRVRESIERSMDRIVVGVDGSLTITARPDGLLSVEGYLDMGGEAPAVEVLSRSTV